ncbi:hypothetical protein BJX99DRAFT_262646 [Aspergillus californicus]
MAFLQEYLDPFSSKLTYIVGVISIVRGIQCWVSPARQYDEYGLPQENAISPLIYAKGIQDYGFGLLLLILNTGGHANAVTLLILVGALMSLADGFVILRNGKKGTAWRHLVVGLIWGLWYWLRLPLNSGPTYQVTVRAS